MKYLVAEPLTLETSQGKVILPAGKILELSLDQAARLGPKIELMPPPNEGRDLPHYCTPAACWCSEKLPAANYPAGCSKCEYVDRAPAPGAEREAETTLATGKES